MVIPWQLGEKLRSKSLLIVPKTCFSGPIQRVGYSTHFLRTKCRFRRWGKMEISIVCNCRSWRGRACFPSEVFLSIWEQHWGYDVYSIYLCQLCICAIQCKLMLQELFSRPFLCGCGWFGVWSAKIWCTDDSQIDPLPTLAPTLPSLVDCNWSGIFIYLIQLLSILTVMNGVLSA